MQRRCDMQHTLRTGRMYIMKAVKAPANAVKVAQMSMSAVHTAPG